MKRPTVIHRIDFPTRYRFGDLLAVFLLLQWMEAPRFVSLAYAVLVVLFWVFVLAARAGEEKISVIAELDKLAGRVKQCEDSKDSFSPPGSSSKH